MTHLVLIRHGETDWNVEGRYQGQADPALNQAGLRQAHGLAETMQQLGLQVLYSSPLKRAAQTAEILAHALGLPLQYEPRLMEIHQGDWQTRLRSEIEICYPDLFRRWEREPWQVSPPGGESLKTVQRRVRAAVQEILHNHPNGQVGLVSHRIPIALIKMQFQDLPPETIRTLHLPNTYWEVITARNNHEEVSE